MDVMTLATEEDQVEFFRQSFSRFWEPEAKEAAKRAKLIFTRPCEGWPSQKVVVEFEGRRRYYPAGANIGRALADASDTLMFEILMGGKF